MQLWLNYRF